MYIIEESHASSTRARELGSVGVPALVGELASRYVVDFMLAPDRRVVANMAKEDERLPDAPELDLPVNNVRSSESDWLASISPLTEALQEHPMLATMCVRRSTCL